MDEKERHREEKEERAARKAQGKVVDPQEEWKKQAMANAKAKKKAKVEEYKDRKKT